MKLLPLVAWLIGSQVLAFAEDSGELNAGRASAFAKMALAGIAREYPNKPGEVLTGLLLERVSVLTPFTNSSVQPLRICTRPLGSANPPRRASRPPASEFRYSLSGRNARTW